MAYLAIFIRFGLYSKKWTKDVNLLFCIIKISLFARFQDKIFAKCTVFSLKISCQNSKYMLNFP